jgi:hypothetical protein
MKQAQARCTSKYSTSEFIAYSPISKAMGLSSSKLPRLAPLTSPSDRLPGPNVQRHGVEKLSENGP